MPLCHCPGTAYSAFYANQSIQKPKKYDDPAATANARIGAMLRYTFCVSRFAHYIKAIFRDKTGSFAEASECEDYLHRWLQKYVTADPEASTETKAELPLRQANVRVRPIPGKPGGYSCVVELWPHYELDELVGTLRLTPTLKSGYAG
jgi:type VI secretion system ImpC/EvpB family protein